MIFYHGTDSTQAIEILKNGLNPAFLTQSEEQAEYYAETTSESNETNPVVLIIDIDPKQFHLIADLPSAEEPLTYTLAKHDFSNESDFHDVLCNENDIDYYWPEEHDWEYSLFLTDCVYCKSKIPDVCIKTADFISILEK